MGDIANVLELHGKFSAELNALIAGIVRNDPAVTTSRNVGRDYAAFLCMRVLQMSGEETRDAIYKMEELLGEAYPDKRLSRNKKQGADAVRRAVRRLEGSLESASDFPESKSR